MKRDLNLEKRWKCCIVPIRYSGYKKDNNCAVEKN